MRRRQASSNRQYSLRSKFSAPPRSGTNYAIVDPVPSDGYLRNYTLKTPDGVFKVNGDQMLFMRFKELAALDALNKTAGSKRFADAVVKAGLSPLEFVGNLITKPISTVENTVSGVGQFFDGIASGVRNTGKSQDSAFASITGEAKEKRLLAYKYGVDPYTDFKPLADRLDNLARASALGGLAVKGAFIAVPGAAGAIVSNVSTANTLNEEVRDNSAAQLLDANRKGLVRLGINKQIVEKFLSNRNYTPVDVIAMVAALTQMRQAARTGHRGGAGGYRAQSGCRLSHTAAGRTHRQPTSRKMEPLPASWRCRAHPSRFV